MNLKNLHIIFLFLLPSGLFGQDTLIGYAPDFVGEKVTLYTCQDYITQTRIKLSEAVVSPVDSIFKLPLKNKNTLKGIVEIENTEAELYLAPKTTYRVYYEKPLSAPISYKNQYVDLMFFGLDSTDINYRILQYNQWFDTFIAYYEKEIQRGLFPAYLDTFKIYIAEEYATVEDDYFLTYVRYNIAEVEQTIIGTKGADKLGTYLEYIEPFPVYYENDQYMKFLLRFYHMDFDDYPPDMEANMYLSVYKSSPTLLMKAMSFDLLLERPDVREVVMIEKLGKLYYEDNRNKGNILTMLDSLTNHALNAHDASAAANLINYVTSLEPGFPAPAINLAIGDTSITWHHYKGKYVYMNFFSTWNETSMSEMNILRSLEEKYGNDIYFLSICTDEKKKDFDKFLAENPEMDWDIVYIGNEDPLLEEFRVKSYPEYFLIDQEGFIASAPAPGPAPNGEYQSIEKTLWTIHKALHPNTPFKVGEY